MTTKSYSEYMADYILRRYHDRMAEARQILGGECAKCGATEGLEIDHVDRTQKSFSISKMWSVSRERFLAELAKCQLLCKSCHRQKTTLERGQTPARGTHGTLSAYRYCKCDECRAANTTYMRKYKRKRRRLATAGR